MLFLNVLVIAMCGLVYELLAGTLASYVLGDSVTQFSWIIGIYLFALGVGAWLSRFVNKGLARCFIEVELGVALLGGASAPLLFLSFGRLSYFHLVLYCVVFGIGVLVGLELPLLMRIVKDHLDFKELVSRVLAFDYIGALVASLLFPIFLVPKLGLVRTSLLFGMFNACIGLWGTWLLQPLFAKRDAAELTSEAAWGHGSARGPRQSSRGARGLLGLRMRAAGVLVILGIGFIKADSLTTLAEEGLFTDDIVYSKTTPYQRIIVTRGKAGFQLYLNGHLQFSSADEYRYHESLVHPAMQASSSPGRVLILGGGDGLALREVLRHGCVQKVTLVDLDPEMTRLSEHFPPLAQLNHEAFQDPRVEVVNQDAMIWLEEAGPNYDAAVIDFPDPNSFSLGKLYTTRFYRLLKNRLTPDAAVGIQCTSPLFARTSYWCIVRTLEAAGFTVKPYHVAVPSFGVWGFALARQLAFESPRHAPRDLRFLNDSTMTAMFLMPADMGPVPVEINRLDNQALVRYYESEWKRWE